MKIHDTHFLRGPNLHAHFPCFEAIVQLDDSEDRPSTDFPGFVDGLCRALPTLRTHRCSRGYEGGFIERLREGTYLPHILEHTMLELQGLAGTEVGFGRAREIDEHDRTYRVVCEYQLESVAEAALEIAANALATLLRGEALDLAGDIAHLRDLAARHALGPSTRAIVNAAKARHIPCIRVTEDASLIQLGWGKHQKRIQATVTGNTSHIAVEIASDKHLTKSLLMEAGVPVPRGEIVRTPEAAVAAARRLRGMAVVKPLDANQGKGVSTGLSTPEQVREAFERAQCYRSRVIVEQHIEGDDHRALVVDGQFMAASRRLPPQVVGDGVRTVLQLVEALNQDPLRGEGHGHPLTRVPIDEATAEMVGRQGLKMDSVIPAGMTVVLRSNANLSTGGTAEDVTEKTHPEVAAACVRAARKIGLDVAGIDVVCRDISRPLEEQGGGIVEVNAAPGIRMHEHPTRGERHHVGEAILQTLFPDGNDGRIPLVAVTGTNGKTTTTLLIAHAMETAGLVTGVATTEGIRIGGHIVKQGDCTGFWSARTVLTSPEVEAAVLETARGGILRRGVGFDRCDVGVVLNIDDDHVGQDFVQSVDEIARAKRVVAECATKAAVLNAADPRCVAMAGHLRPGVRVIYFCMRDVNRTLFEHLENGGSAVYVRKGMIMMAIGEHRIPLVEVERLPFALEGAARHNVANALAAAAALWGCGFDRERIVSALLSFENTAEHNPLRMNLFTCNGVSIVVDYAHNAASYRAIIQTARELSTGRIVGVVTAPGDRRDDRLREIGAICARGFDELVVYEMDDARGRAAGQTAEQLIRGAEAAGVPRERVGCVLPVQAAVRAGFERCHPGDVLVLGCASNLSDLTAALPEARESVHVHPAHPHGMPAFAASDAALMIARPIGEQARGMSKHH